ncbi:MAG TPA: 3-dehydroquinate synthase [Caulobacteraceae bacterium]|jgi:3-dehydroquinate synthase
MTVVRVEPKDGAAYEVVIGEGLLAEAGARVRPLLARPFLAVVADETTARLHGPALLQGLADGGVEAAMVTAPPGEGSKSFAQLADLIDRLLALGLDRKDMVLALGGGVIGDLAGLAAALYMRGVGCIQAPTTLLAQVDSSVGGKTAIDTPRGKNLVGAFHQPRLVLADTTTLATLPKRQMAAGYAEMVKTAILGDADYFDALEADGAALLETRGEALHAAIARAVRMKAEIVADDPREQGRRALLNLGHTFGHALEAEAGMGEALLHGEAVALGCVLALKLSSRLGLAAAGEASRAAALLAQAGLPVRLNDVKLAFDAERLLGSMAGDKKAEGGRLTFVLARRIGESLIVRDVDPQVVLTLLRDEGAA